jgi:hypothetical protein
VPNPVNPGAVTPNVRLGKLSTGTVHEQFPLMGMIVSFRSWLRHTGMNETPSW